jgi:two-component system sensor histidine kinase/response regulator
MSALPAVKILVVDDLEGNLDALDALLRGETVEILRARSGRDALELLLVHDVALALLDVQMPEMDGFELAELMRGTARTRHVPIIFLTAGAHDTQRMFRGYEVGAVDFLFKPIDPVLLGHKVRTFVELHAQRLERERLAGELQEMLRLTEMFVAVVSHDLRAPLSTVIMGAALLDASLSDPTAKATLGRVRSSAGRMLGMLEQLYDLSRVRLGGGISVDPRETDFLVLAQRVFEELRLAYRERTLTFECDEGSALGFWDEARMAQVLTNVVGNALRYGTRDEGVEVRIHCASPTLVVEVHNGGEIPADVRAQLFDPFRRGPQARSRDGLGLGLYIARQIVAAHHGTIDVSSSREAGTTFRVHLPRRPAEENAGSPSAIFPAST